MDIIIYIDMIINDIINFHQKKTLMSCKDFCPTCHCEKASVASKVSIKNNVLIFNKFAKCLKMFSHFVIMSYQMYIGGQK